MSKKEKTLPTWCDDTAAIEFRNIAREPASWLHVAESLKLAADVLRPAAVLEHKRVLEESLRVRRSRSGPCPHEAVSLPKPASLIGPYMLLAGYAMENLLKAIYACRFSKRFEPGKLPWKGQQGHDLLWLAEESALIPRGEVDGKPSRLSWKELDDAGFAEDADLLEQLRRYIVHGGRYPIPRSIAQCDEIVGFHTVFFSHFDRLFARFKEELAGSTRDDQQGG